ncbi:ABC transporter ATP-binding protein [Streptomonospora litoralis]|uniref:Lipid A export ATP-binding/permease protein MsbA n=1 Tax=Streptomonospora litoralis TaxID=2498135 RepID=A0A4P6Q8B3_9ACTN|nr:ABC transporter ATP-binding protein [Streptomonospora litoralis]QBI55439.1 Lipid A export ATP-binding/permease protein MsbA [Streptomonospora litoralis]
MASTRPRDGASDKGAARSADALLARMTRASAGRTAGILLCAAGAAAVSVALPAVLGRTLDLLLQGHPDAGRALAAAVALTIAEVVLNAAVALLAGTVGARSTAWLRLRGLGRLAAAAPHGVSRFSPGDAATRLSTHATEAGAAPAGAARIVAAVLAPTGALVALFVIDLWTGLAFVLGLPVLGLLLRSFARHSSDSVSRYQRVQSVMATRLTDALGGARAIAAAGTVDEERARILRPLEELGAEGRRMWSVQGSAMARSGVLMPLLITAVLAVGGLALADGRISVGDLLAVSRYASLAAGLGSVAGPLGALVHGRAAARRVDALLAVPPLAHGQRGLPPGGPGTLELRGVGVSRDGEWALRGVDLHVPGGRTVAVVGRSGSGKSTLGAVAGRLTDPDEGEVLLDGVPLGTVAADVLRTEVGYAFERPSLQGATVEEAIAAGAETAPRERVRSAARAAGADDFVRVLPQGYATPLEEVPLSGGELQRLGLARAFAHAGRLMILDDATSSLDTATERQVDRALAREIRPGTRVVIAHRLSTAARADAVVWLDGGRLRAVRGHAELWQDPDYRAVFGHADASGGGGNR